MNPLLLHPPRLLARLTQSNITATTRFVPLLRHPQAQQTRAFLIPLVQSTSNVLTQLSYVLAPVGVAVPWYAVLPLFAISLRTATTLPLTVYARGVSRQIVELQPLVSAWERVIGGCVARERVGPVRVCGDEGKGKGQEEEKEVGEQKKEPISPEEWKKVMKRSMWKKRKEIYKTFGCSSWKAYLSFAQIPVWLVASLAVRGMTLPASEAPPTEPPATTEAIGMAEAGAESTSTQVGYFQSILDSVPLEDSLSTGGALWFPDLLAPDPFYILPILLSLAMFANIEFQALQYPTSVSHREALIKQILRVLALGVIPVTMQTSVALTLYWLSSSLFSLAQNVLLHYWYPIPRPVAPCSPRPLIGFEEMDEPWYGSSAGAGRGFGMEKLKEMLSKPR